jgi:hypothetical protein
MEQPIVLVINVQDGDVKDAVDPYKHQKAYFQKKYHTDEEYRFKSIQKSKDYILDKYHNDPEFRADLLKKNNQRYKERCANDPEYKERRRVKMREYRQNKKQGCVDI